MNTAVKYDGITVEYSDHGKGRTVVLLHGYLEAKEVWDPLRELLQTSYRVICIDLPGHGRSGVKGDTHTMEFLAGAVLEVIKSTGAGRVLLAGHSLGGYAALAFAEKYADMLAGYILFHSHPNADTPETVEKRRREITVVKAGKKDLMYPANISMMFAVQNLPVMKQQLERSKHIASMIEAEGIIAMLNGMMTRPARRYVVESGRVPLLWILGRHDRYFSPGKALAGIKIPDNAGVVILEASGHLGFVEETDLCLTHIDRFAQSLTW